MSDWIVLARSRVGAVSLLRCKSESEAVIVFDNLNPMRAEGGSYTPADGDIEHLHIINPDGLTVRTLDLRYYGGVAP